MLSSRESATSQGMVGFQRWSARFFTSVWSDSSDCDWTQTVTPPQGLGLTASSVGLNYCTTALLVESKGKLRHGIPVEISQLLSGRKLSKG